MRLGSFTYLLKQGAKNTYLNKAMSFASVGVLAACLVIVGFSVLISENVRSIIGYVQDQNEIVVYLDDDITEDNKNALEIKLSELENVTEMSYTSKEEAFQSQKDKLGELLDGYENENVFPASFHLKISDLGKIEQDVETIKNLNGVYLVDAPTTVADFMVKLEKGIMVICWVIIIALLIGAFVIIMNTIKITVYSRRREINIMKYVGATNSFIRMPFLVEGMILGAVAAIVAFFIVWALYERIYMGIDADSASFISSLSSSIIPFSKVGWKLALAYLATGVVIGGLGSTTSTRKHLKV